MTPKTSGKAKALYTSRSLQPYTPMVWPSDEKWLTTAEIVQYFNVSERTVIRWRKNGIIPSTKLGGTVFYPFSLVNHILRNRILPQVVQQDLPPVE